MIFDFLQYIFLFFACTQTKTLNRKINSRIEAGRDKTGGIDMRCFISDIPGSFQ